MNRKQIKSMLMAVPFSLLLSGCGSAGLQIPEDGITIELGTELSSSVADYVSAEEYKDITVDLQAVNSHVPGTYAVPVFYKGREAGTVLVTIADTTAPVAELPEMIRLEKNTVCYADAFAAHIADFSETQVWFLTNSLRRSDMPEAEANLTEENLTKELCLETDGNYQVTVLIRDTHGNHTLYPLGIEVYTPDTEAPVITAKDLTVTLGQTPDYLAGVSAADNIDGELTSRIQVDVSQVLLDKAGNYPILYSVTDTAGNIGTKECLLTVQEVAKGTSATVKQEAAIKTETPDAETQQEAMEAPDPVADTPSSASQPVDTPAPKPSSDPEPEVTPQPSPAATPEPAPPVTPTPTPAPSGTDIATEVQPSAPVTSGTQEVSAGFDTAKADELLSLVNAEREAKGLGTVSVKDSLTEKAKERVQNGNYSGSGVISCYGTGATSAAVVIENWKADWPDGTWLTANWKYAGAACYIDGNTYTWIVVFGAY